MTLEESAEAEVKTLLLCLISRMEAPEGPIDPEEVVALASEKTTLSKLAKGTRELPSSKSSTIHSAFSWQRAAVEVRDLVTVFPVVLFSMTALPALVVEEVTVTVISSPALMSMPEKSCETAGYHSYQAERNTMNKNGWIYKR